MTARSSFAKREKSLAEQVIIVLMIGALMASFVYYFFKEESEICFSHRISRFFAKSLIVKGRFESRIISSASLLMVIFFVIYRMG